MKLLRHGPRTITAFLLAVMLAACGGGGSDGVADDPGATGATPPPVAADTGNVGIMFTDMPSEDFDQIVATIAGIELIGESRTATLFSGPAQEVDFLQLESFTEVFAVAENVPAGDYNKIRLILDDLRVVKLDDQDNVVEETSVRLPGNGKVDLNPRQTFFVMPGTTMLVQIDLDAKKSIKVNLTGNGDKYQFRPVAFVKISGQEMDGKLARIFGTAGAIDTMENSFVLCQDGRASDPNDGDSDSDSDSDSDENNNCLTVQLFDDTGIFDTNGDPIDASLIMTGEPLTAIGNLRVSGEATDGDSDGESDSNTDSDSDSDAAHDDDDLILDAFVVEFGDLGTFERLKGEVAEDFDEGTKQFGLTIASGQGFADDTRVNGLVQMGTRIFDKQANPLDTSALTAGRMGHFDGVITLSNSEPDVLKTSLIVLDPDLDVSESIFGEILSVTPAERTLMLLVDSMERCVSVPEGTDISVVTITDTATESGPAELADLMPGWPAEIYGMEANGCFMAESIRAENDQRTTGTNAIPVADAGMDQAVTTGESVMLDGSGSSDADGDMLSYSWTLQVPTGSGATLDSMTIVNPAFTTDVDGDYIAELVVSDGMADSAAVTVTVTATPGGGTQTPDGAMLYADFCAACHGSLANTEVPNATSSEIQNAINNNVGGMRTNALMALTSEEVQAIADALSQ